MTATLRETLILAVGAATALKLLLLAPGAYHSTDFEEVEHHVSLTAMLYSLQRSQDPDSMLHCFHVQTQP
jgi:hypothetical protein